MGTHSVPAQVKVTSGRFVDNRRARVTVNTLALGLAELVLDQPPTPDAPAVTTRIVVSGRNLSTLIAALQEAEDTAVPSMLREHDRTRLERWSA